jgi:hypothetical protein
MSMSAARQAKQVTQQSEVDICSESKLESSLPSMPASHLRTPSQGHDIDTPSYSAHSNVTHSSTQTILCILHRA